MRAAQAQLTPFVAGPEAYQALPGLAEPFGERLLLIGGERAMAAASGRLLAALRGSGLQLVDSIVAPKVVSFDAARSLALQAHALDAQLILGMGGGRALDTAKAAAELAGLPVVCLPTIAATCAATSGLSVLYRADGSFDRFLFLGRPPLSALIDTEVLKKAPVCYLRAGIGDSLSKHVEALFSARGASLHFTDQLGLSIADGLFDRLLSLGGDALRDADKQQEAALISIVSVGYVSQLVQEGFNGALAHSLYYALEPLLMGKELLHGEFVAWGALCQLWLDNQQQKALRLRDFLQAIGIPVSLAEMGLDAQDAVLRSHALQAAQQPDMALLPYPVSGEMIHRAIDAIEQLSMEVPSVV